MLLELVDRYYVGGLDVRRAFRRRRFFLTRLLRETSRSLRLASSRRRISCLPLILSLASDQGGSPAEFKHISKRRKRN